MNFVFIFVLFAQATGIKPSARAAPYVVRASPAKQVSGKAMAGVGAAEANDFDAIAPPQEAKTTAPVAEHHAAAAATPEKKPRKVRRDATAGEHPPVATGTPERVEYGVIGGGGAASATAAALTPSSALARQLHLEELAAERARQQSEQASAKAAAEAQREEAQRLAKQLHERVIVPWQKPKIHAEDDPDRQSVRIEVFLPLLDTLAVHQLGSASAGPTVLKEAAGGGGGSAAGSAPSRQFSSGRPELVVAATPDLSSFEEHQEYLPRSMRVSIPRLQLDVHVVGKKDFRSDDVSASYDSKTGVCVLQVRGARLAGGSQSRGGSSRGGAGGKSERAGEARASSKRREESRSSGRSATGEEAPAPRGGRRLRRVSMFRMDRGAPSVAGGRGGLRRVEESDED